jgi:hypothetical protein
MLTPSLRKRKNFPFNPIENYISVIYPGILAWHEHRHLNRSWEEKHSVRLI